uniref:Uncharacterized protein n=1 Tax=Oryza meridionalis TaxID=40149 RepID=A0A0E0DGX3_9ORYZ
MRRRADLERSTGAFGGGIGLAAQRRRGVGISGGAWRDPRGGEDGWGDQMDELDEKKSRKGER